MHQSCLDPLEGLLLWYENIYDDDLLTIKVNFSSTSDLKILQLRLQDGVHLQLEQSLYNSLVNCIGFSAAAFDNLRRHTMSIFVQLDRNSDCTQGQECFPCVV